MLWKWIRVERTFETLYDATDGTTITETVLVADQALRPWARVLPIGVHLALARRRGDRDRRAGVKRSGVPIEYRAIERRREALQWCAGWTAANEELRPPAAAAPQELDHSGWPKHIRDNIHPPGYVVDDNTEIPF